MHQKCISITNGTSPAYSYFFRESEDTILLILKEIYALSGILPLRPGQVSSVVGAPAVPTLSPLHNPARGGFPPPSAGPPHHVNSAPLLGGPPASISSPTSISMGPPLGGYSGGPPSGPPPTMSGPPPLSGFVRQPPK